MQFPLPSSTTSDHVLALCMDLGLTTAWDIVKASAVFLSSYVPRLKLTLFIVSADLFEYGMQHFVIMGEWLPRQLTLWTLNPAGGRLKMEDGTDYFEFDCSGKNLLELEDLWEVWIYFYGAILYIFLTA